MDKGISAGMERGYCAAFTIMEHFDNPSMMCGISAKYGKAEILYAALVELCRSFLRVPFTGEVAGTFREME